LIYLIAEFLKRNNIFDTNRNLPWSTKKEIKKLVIILFKEISKNWIITRQGDSSFKRNILKSIHATRDYFLENNSLKIE
jgi:hypothetical protein